MHGQDASAVLDEIDEMAFLGKKLRHPAEALAGARPETNGR